ncbi:M56 family metallopeptidase [Flavobacterium cheonhonense]|uniref:M56 family metallopeptidase n=1 Tax=Flavobacterium cheonhonense TaxID=706185 RepID=UPI002D79E2E9|nr:M56 family metallopeptidase [Flavobacterium cheonhonense]
MTDFLIKSTVSLLVFLVFYHWVLEREKTHLFNRFYLLLAIVISLAIPFLSFEIIEEVPVTTITEPEFVPIPFSNENIAVVETIDYTSIAVWSLYGIITILLSIRFGKNIWKLISKSDSNPTVKYKNATLVLVDEKTLPHTFLNNIFINFDDYNQRNIEDELYTHELVHVTQKHTLDILFIELLITIFWFNPLLYFYKKAIQLNHEFLADQKVVESYNNVPFYQNLLLQKGNGNQTIYLASNLNYLVTKKRLIMMTKNTTKSVAFLKKTAIIPMLTGIVFLCCVDIIAQEKIVTKATPKNNTIDEQDYFKGVRIRYYEKLVKTKNGAKYSKIIFDKKYENLTKSEKEEIQLFLMIPKPFEKKSPTAKELNEYKNAKKYAIWIDGKNVPNKELNQYKPEDIAYFSGSVILKNARTKKHPQPFQYWFYTHPHFEKEKMDKPIPKYPGKEIVIWKEGRTKNIMLSDKSAVKATTITEVPTKKQESDLYNLAELTEKPEYQTGLEAFYQYIGSNYKIPEEISTKKISGKIFASFIVEKDGTLSNIKILRDMGYGTGEEAKRVLENSPKWLPGKIDGKPVRTMYSLPIAIKSE